MECYFLLLDDERIIDKVQPAGLGNVKFEELPLVSILPVDWLGKPMRMASDRMRSLMEKYNRHIRFKRVELIDTKTKRAALLLDHAGTGCRVSIPAKRVSPRRHAEAACIGSGELYENEHKIGQIEMEV